MDRKITIENALGIDELQSELELERARLLHGKLRWMAKEDPSLAPIREHIGKLTQAYEAKHWSDIDSITERQIWESDQAEVQARKELHEDEV